jgi:hypothetical protein
MTFSNFEEKEKGSLEVGKCWFLMYDQDLMKVENKIVKMKPNNHLGQKGKIGRKILSLFMIKDRFELL